MKWFFIGSACLLCSATRVNGDAASDFYNQGLEALRNSQFSAAAYSFDSVITDYPNSPDIDDARIKAGYCYLRVGRFPEAIDRLAVEAGPNGKPKFRGTALYFTALVQFSQGQKTADKVKAAGALSQAVATLTSLINLVTTAPTPDNKGYLEEAIYYRALAEYLQNDGAAAEKDLLQVIQQFPASPSRPDYYLSLGSVYAQETSQAVTDKKPPDVIKAQAQKAVDAFDQVSGDPNALVQSNEANMSKAEVLFLIASLDPTPAGYEKALEAFRQVRRKADMIPLQQARVDAFKKQSQAQLQNSPTSYANDSSFLINREEDRLNDLQQMPDPIIHALIRMAECYLSITQPDGTHESDEARTILHRLLAHATLTPDQQQEVDFQTLYSYVLGGQTDQADRALTDYLGKHPGDPLADGISYQIAAKLMERNDFNGALSECDRSLKDFPQGRYVAGVYALKAQALNRLGRIAESDQVADDFLKRSPTSPLANQMFLTKAQSESSRGDFTTALADYQKVKDNASAGPELRAAAGAGYIQALYSLQRFDDVIREAKSFEILYPSSPALPNVLLLAGMVMDQRRDPGAVAALQDVARRFPKAETAPFALFYVVNYYQQANNFPALVQAVNDLSKAYPQAYDLIMQAADAESAFSVKAKQFDQAIALYQPLVDAPRPGVAAAARNKIGAIWLSAAHSLGYYQSMAPATREEADKRLAASEQAYLGTLKTFPGQLGAVGDALDGLVSLAKQRRSWGLLKDADLEGYFGQLEAGGNLTAPDMEARFDLAKAGLVFIYKNGAKQYGAALDRFKKVIDANPGLRLTRQETDQFGELLLAARDFPGALKAYGDLLSQTDPKDQAAQGDAYYGLGATYLGQGDVAQAKTYFLKLKALPQGGAWHPHILDADYGVALADENSSQPADLEEARQAYAQLMQSPQGGVVLQAKAMLGYGHLLEKSGNALNPTAAGPTEFAVHYYLEPDLLFGPATPAQSAQGLYEAGQAYEKAGDKANAKKQYDDLLKNYGSTAPDWAAKAQRAEALLGTS